MKIKLISFLLFITICTGCKFQKEKVSYWATQKDKFKFKNLNQFVSDSLLRMDLSSCYRMRDNSIDGFSTSGNLYLYSWQERDSTTDEFTLIGDRGELGLDIYYMILEKNGKLLNWLKLAGAGNEGGYLFEIKSKFIKKDSILQVRATTQWLGPDGRMNKTLGDSTFLYITINSLGKMTEKVFKEIKELNFQKIDSTASLDCKILLHALVESSSYNSEIKKLDYNVEVEEVTEENYFLKIVVRNEERQDDVTIGWLKLDIINEKLYDITFDLDKPVELQFDVSILQKLVKNCKL